MSSPKIRKCPTCPCNIVNLDMRDEAAKKWNTSIHSSLFHAVALALIARSQKPSEAGACFYVGLHAPSPALTTRSLRFITLLYQCTFQHPTTAVRGWPNPKDAQLDFWVVKLKLPYVMARLGLNDEDLLEVNIPDSVRIHFCQGKRCSRIEYALPPVPIVWALLSHCYRKNSLISTHFPILSSQVGFLTIFLIWGNLLTLRGSAAVALTAIHPESCFRPTNELSVIIDYLSHSFWKASR